MDEVSKLNEPGLKYVASLNIQSANSLSGLEKQLSKATSAKFAKKVVTFIRTRGDAQSDAEDCDNLSFYNLKNTNLKASMTISGAYDSDYIRKTCNWIAANSYLFGERILEVGCDCGIFSCFLAKQFPKSHIVSIDQCEAAINVAKELASKFKIKNIEFVHAKIDEMSSEKFDTVFSSKTMHENFCHQNHPDITHLFSYQGTVYASLLKDYANSLRVCLKESGNLISIERCGKNPLLYGWMLALNESGLVANSGHIGEIISKELEDNHCQFQIIVANVAEPKPESYIFNLIQQVFAKQIKTGKDICQWGGWEASLILQVNLRNLVKGYYLFYNNEIKGKIALWTNRSDEDSLLCEQHMKDNRGLLLSNCSMGAKANALHTIHTDIKNFIQQGYEAKRFYYDGQREIIESTADNRTVTTEPTKAGE